MKFKTTMLIATIMIIGSIILTGCMCGNKTLIDTTYTYNKAIIYIGGKWETLNIVSWDDYEGEQIQIEDEDGNIYLVNSVNCTLIKED